MLIMALMCVSGGLPEQRLEISDFGAHPDMM